MMLPLLASLMLAAQPAAAPAQAQTPAPTPSAEPPAPPPPSARLEAAISELKGRPQTAFTAKLGPPGSTRQATDGQVLFWTITLPGETVCGAGASGALDCRRQGGGDCVIAVAFQTDGAMRVWRTSGLPEACEKAADQLTPAG